MSVNFLNSSLNNLNHPCLNVETISDTLPSVSFVWRRPCIFSRKIRLLSRLSSIAPEDPMTSLTQKPTSSSERCKRTKVLTSSPIITAFSDPSPPPPPNVQCILVSAGHCLLGLQGAFFVWTKSTQLGINIIITWKFGWCKNMDEAEKAFWLHEMPARCEVIMSS